MTIQLHQTGLLGGERGGRTPMSTSRMRITLRFSVVKAIPRIPHVRPTTAAGTTAATWLLSCVCTSKKTVDASPSNSPN